MRKSALFIGFIATHIVLITIMVLHARRSQDSSISERLERTELVQALRLTDLCLFTEARYTRHPSMADRFAPFQDHPTSLEHFPSGSLVTPPLPHRQDTRVNDVMYHRKNAGYSFAPTK